MLELKKMGLSDARLAKLTLHSVIPVLDTGIYGKNECGITSEQIEAVRKKFGINPVYKRVDTCAAEFESSTAYMYGCYEGMSFQCVTLESRNKEPVWITLVLFKISCQKGLLLNTTHHVHSSPKLVSNSQMIIIQKLIK